MMHRRISERVNKIAPFLTFDPDPVPGDFSRAYRVDS